MMNRLFGMIFMHIPFVVAIRDGENHTLLGNPVLARFAGRKLREVKGLSDFEAPWSVYAEIYAKQDQDALRGVVYRQFEPCMTKEGYKVLLTEKIPFKNSLQNKKVLLSVAVEITEKEILSTLHLVEHYSPLSEGNVLIISNSSYLREKFPDNHFGHKDIECIYYLLRGRSAKVIARYFNCSSKTIEARLERLRGKFQCSSKQMLVEKLTEFGFMTMIPESILKRRLGHPEILL